MSIDFSDQDLVSRVRHGDTAAFGDLYAHHSAGAHRAARRFVRDPHVAEDVVSEAFARVFKALQAGQGPTGDLFPYLLVTMRNVAASWGRESSRWTPVGDDAAFQPRDARDSVAGADELPVDRLNMSLTSSAFETLPRRWRTVLWYLEVEGESATDVGQRLGLSDVAVRQLARRAREGLREAYLAAYLGTTPTVGEHVPSADLVSMARGKLSLRRRVPVEKHLDTCARCSGMLFEAAEENSTLRALALPFYAAVAYAIVKATQGLRGLPRVPGRRLYRHPVGQAALVAAGIVGVVTVSLAATSGLHDGAGTAAGGLAGVSTTGRGARGGGGAPASLPPSTSATSATSSPSASKPTSTSPTPTPTPTPATTAPPVPTSTVPPPGPTGSTTRAPLQTGPVQLPTVIFPTATTSETTAAPTGPADVTPSGGISPATTVPPATTAPTSATSTAPPTTAPPTTTTTTATTAAPTTTTTTAAPTTTVAPPVLPALSVTSVTVAADAGDPDTTVTVTVANNSTAAHTATLTLTLPAGAELATDVTHLYCRAIAGPTVVACIAIQPPLGALGSGTDTVSYPIRVQMADGGTLPSAPTVSVAVYPGG